MKKILLVSSSSGGHVYPSYCLGEELKKMGYQITYLGIIGKIEEDIIKEGVFFDIPSSFKIALSKEGLTKIRNAYPKIKRLIKENDLIIGFGGFITFLISLINIKVKKKIYVHEQNVILGDSIKYSYIWVDKLLLTYDNQLKKLSKSKVVGNPTTYNIIHRKDINIKNPKIMFVFGSLSSETCLRVVKSFLINTKLKNQILVVTGEKFFDMFDDIKLSNVILKKKINMRNELLNYDLVFARGGATTLMELLKSGVEIVCIPSPYVKRNHQFKNAKFFENKGYIRILKEKEFNTKNIENIIINLNRINTYQYQNDPIKNIIEEVEND